MCTSFILFTLYNIYVIYNYSLYTWQYLRECKHNDSHPACHTTAPVRRLLTASTNNGDTSSASISCKLSRHQAQVVSTNYTPIVDVPKHTQTVSSNLGHFEWVICKCLWQEVTSGVDSYVTTGVRIGDQVRLVRYSCEYTGSRTSTKTLQL